MVWFLQQLAPCAFGTTQRQSSMNGPSPTIDGSFEQPSGINAAGEKTPTSNVCLKFAIATGQMTSSSLQKPLAGHYGISQNLTENQFNAS
jgi:hypothetical protein